METATGCFFFIYRHNFYTDFTLLDPNPETLVIHSVISPRSEYHERVMKRRAYPEAMKRGKGRSEETV
jgi:hypothetical protein